MRMCWSRHDAAAADAVRKEYHAVVADLRRHNVDPQPFVASQTVWTAARDKTCEFEYDLNEGGTIAPLLGVECDYRMTQARSQRLAALRSALHSRGATMPEAPVSAAADRELNRVYRLYQKQLNSKQRDALTAAEVAWLSYRDKACAIEGGACLTELEKERVAELKAGWIGEAFW